MKKQQAILGSLCILLPVLSIGFGIIGWLRGVNYPGWYESVSATYYANSKIIMIGILFASGVYFWAYKGYDKLDSSLTTTTAIMAFALVAFPTGDSNATAEEIVGIFCLPVGVSGIIHNCVAGTLYSTFILELMRFLKHGETMTPMKIVRNRIYIMCLILMFVGVGFIFACSFVPALRPYHFFILIGECFDQLGYGFAWLVKADIIPCFRDK